jgi:hypothetical protein
VFSASIADDVNPGIALGLNAEICIVVNIII